jgi:hypothetical protein
MSEPDVRLDSVLAGTSGIVLQGIGSRAKRLKGFTTSSLAVYPFLKGEGDDKNSKQIYHAITQSFDAIGGILDAFARVFDSGADSLGFATNALTNGSVDAVDIASGGGGRGR